MQIKAFELNAFKPPIYNNQELMRQRSQSFTIFAHTSRIGTAAQKSDAIPQNSGPVLNFFGFLATTPEDNL